MAQKKLINLPINKKELATLKEDSFIWFSSLAIFFLILVTVVFILLNWSRLPPQVPLFYSRPWGERQLAPPIGLLLLPIFSLGVLCLNLLLAVLAFKEQVLFRRILVTTSLVITILFSLTTYKIIALIT